MTNIKDALAKKSNEKDVKVTKSMSISDTIKAFEPEIKRALPSVITPERFTRMALSALNNNPKLAECTQISFITALMSAAQLGLEPNTPLGQAYLIPYNNKGKLECQFQLGYKGMIDLVYRNALVQTIQAHSVYENDYFEYELGMNAQLIHKPALENRGNVILFYALFKLQNGGYGFEVMNKNDIDVHANIYSKACSSNYSPWKTDYESMAKKTVIKKLLKYAPLKTECLRAIHSDETIKSQIEIDISEINDSNTIDNEFIETNKMGADEN